MLPSSSCVREGFREEGKDTVLIVKGQVADAGHCGSAPCEQVGQDVGTRTQSDPDGGLVLPAIALTGAVLTRPAAAQLSRNAAAQAACSSNRFAASNW